MSVVCLDGIRDQLRSGWKFMGVSRWPAGFGVAEDGRASPELERVVCEDRSFTEAFA
jgi:hypothetical protein